MNVTSLIDGHEFESSEIIWTIPGTTIRETVLTPGFARALAVVSDEDRCSEPWAYDQEQDLFHPISSEGLEHPDNLDSLYRAICAFEGNPSDEMSAVVQREIDRYRAKHGQVPINDIIRKGLEKGT